MDDHAVRAMASIAARRFESFSEATRSVLAMLEAQLPGTAVFAAQIDHERDELLIIDATGDDSFGLEAGVTVSLDNSFCVHMAADRAPRLCNATADDPVYSTIQARADLEIESYVGVPLELTDGTRVGSLCALAHQRDRFGESDLQLLTVMARVLAQDLEREQRERSLHALNGVLRQQASDFAVLGRVTRALATAADARETVCQATLEATGASFTALYEPDPTGTVRPTAAAVAAPGIDAIAIAWEEPPGVATALRENCQLIVTNPSTDPAAAGPLASATGMTACVFEPIDVRGDVLGVLLVAWRHPNDPIGERVAKMMHLLAGEAAVAIERADAAEALREQALTDALTGLPNRRAWDAELVRAVARAERAASELSAVIVDLDRFKSFNDEHGHPAGDQLLAEAAVAWRAALREGDFLARYGGEEFAILLPDCPLADALVVVERLRGATPRGQTCSAGVAHWDGSESHEELVARADSALYAAKGAGRDLAAVAA